MSGFVAPPAKVLPVCPYVWNLGIIHLRTTRNPDQTDQPCILHILRIKAIIRTEKASLIFCISKELCHRILTTTIWPVPRNFCQSLGHGRIATKREEYNWHQQGLWLHWQMNSDMTDVQLPSLTCDPNCWGHKRTPAIVSLSDLPELQKKEASSRFFLFSLPLPYVVVEMLL
jgi:hypothetical protein